MECMLMHFLLSPTVYGGIGVITPMAGEVLLITVGVAILLIMVGITGLMVGTTGLMAGEASTVVGVGDTIIIIIPVEAGTPVADPGEVTIGAMAYTQTAVTMEHVPQQLAVQSVLIEQQLLPGQVEADK